MMPQLLSSGYSSCLDSDAITFVSWASEFSSSFKHGTIYPRWTAQSFWGYGSPTFILYSPLAFHITTLISFVTGSIISAMNFVKFLSFALAAAGIFFLLREFYSEKTAFLSALFYLLLPYNIFGIYFFWTFATTAAMIWYAPLLLCTYRFIQTGSFVYAVYAGVCFAGLIMTHLISAYMFMCLLIIFVFYMAIVKRNMKICAALPVIFLIGLLLSSAYLLPLLVERQMINLGGFIRPFYYGDYFVTSVLTGKQAYWPGYYWQFSFNVRLFWFFLAVFICFHIWLRQGEGFQNTLSVTNYFIGAALMTLFLVNRASSPLWEIIPSLGYIQFPFRWLTMSAFAVTFLSSALFHKIENMYLSKIKRYLIFGMFCLIYFICILLSLSYIKSAPELTKNELLPPRSVNWTFEHLPASVELQNLEKDENPENRVIFITGEGKVNYLEWLAERRRVSLFVTRGGTVRIKTFYFPGWVAFIDGKPASVSRDAGTSAMTVAVPTGEHLLTLEFIDTPIRFYAKVITLLSLLGVLVLVWSKKRLELAPGKQLCIRQDN